MELARPIWCGKWPNSPGSEGVGEEEMVKKKERGKEKQEGRGGEGEVRLKTDQQPERLNTAARLCSDFHSNFYAQSKQRLVFTRLS